MFKTVKDIVPLVDPNDIEITGWDINSMDLYQAALNSKVLEPTLLSQLKDDLEILKPLKSILNPNYIAKN